MDMYSFTKLIKRPTEDERDDFCETLKGGPYWQGSLHNTVFSIFWCTRGRIHILQSLKSKFMAWKKKKQFSRIKNRKAIKTDVLSTSLTRLHINTKECTWHLVWGYELVMTNKILAYMSEAMQCLKRSISVPPSNPFQLHYVSHGPFLTYKYSVDGVVPISKSDLTHLSVALSNML